MRLEIFWESRFDVIVSANKTDAAGIRQSSCDEKVQFAGYALSGGLSAQSHVIPHYGNARRLLYEQNFWRLFSNSRSHGQ